MHIISQRATDEPARAGQPVRDSLDQPQGGGRGTQGDRDQARQQRGRYLMPHIGQQARRTDPADTPGQPRRMLGHSQRDWLLAVAIMLGHRITLPDAATAYRAIAPTGPNSSDTYVPSPRPAIVDRR